MCAYTHAQRCLSYKYSKISKENSYASSPYP